VAFRVTIAFDLIYMYVDTFEDREREREGVSEREMEGGIEGTYFFFPLPFISVVRYSSIS